MFQGYDVTIQLDRLLQSAGVFRIAHLSANFNMKVQAGFKSKDTMTLRLWFMCALCVVV